MGCIRCVNLSVLLTTITVVMVVVYAGTFLGLYTTYMSDFIISRTTETNAIALKTGSTLVESVLNGVVSSSAKSRTTVMGIFHKFPQLIAPTPLDPGHAFNMSLTTLALSELIDFQSNIYHALFRLMTGLPQSPGAVGVHSRNKWRASLTPLVRRANGDLVLGGGTEVRPQSELANEVHYTVESWVPYLRTDLNNDLYLLRNCRENVTGAYILKDYYVDTDEKQRQFDNTTYYTSSRPARLWYQSPEQFEAYCRAFVPRIIRRDINTLDTLDVTLEYARNVPLYHTNGNKLTAQVIDLAFPPPPSLTEEMKIFALSDMFHNVYDYQTGEHIHIDSIFETINAHERWSREFYMPNGGTTPYLGYALPILPFGYNYTIAGNPTDVVVQAWVTVNLNLDSFAKVLGRPNAKPTANSRMYFVNSGGRIVADTDKTSFKSQDVPQIWPPYPNFADPPNLYQCLNFSGVNLGSANRTHKGIPSYLSPIVEMRCADKIDTLDPSNSIRIVWEQRVRPVLEASSILNNWEDFIPFSVAVSKGGLLRGVTADFVSVKRLITLSGEPSRNPCTKVDVDYILANLLTQTGPVIVDRNEVFASCPFDGIGRTLPYFLVSVVPSDDAVGEFINSMYLTIIIVACCLVVFVIGIAANFMVIFGNLKKVAERIIVVAKNRDNSYVERLSRITEIRNVQAIFISLVERLRETDVANEDEEELEALQLHYMHQQQTKLQQQQQLLVQQQQRDGNEDEEASPNIGSQDDIGVEAEESTIDTRNRLLMKGFRNASLLGVSPSLPSSSYISIPVTCVRITLNMHRLDPTLVAQRELIAAIIKTLGAAEDAPDGTSGKPPPAPEAYLYQADHTTATIIFLPLETLRTIFPQNYGKVSTKGKSRERDRSARSRGVQDAAKASMKEAATRALQFAQSMQITAASNSVLSAYAACYFTIDTDPNALIDVSIVRQQQRRIAQGQSKANGQPLNGLQCLHQPPPNLLQSPNFADLVVWANSLSVTKRLADLQIQRLHTALLLTDRTALYIPPAFLSNAAPVDCVEMYCGGFDGDMDGIGDGRAEGSRVCGYSEADIPALMAAVDPEQYEELREALLSAAPMNSANVPSSTPYYNAFAQHLRHAGYAGSAYRGTNPPSDRGGYMSRFPTHSHYNNLRDGGTSAHSYSNSENGSHHYSSYSGAYLQQFAHHPSNQSTTDRSGRSMAALGVGTVYGSGTGTVDVPSMANSALLQRSLGAASMGAADCTAGPSSSSDDNSRKEREGLPTECVNPLPSRNHTNSNGLSTLPLSSPTHISPTSPYTFASHLMPKLGSLCDVFSSFDQHVPAATLAAAASDRLNKPYRCGSYVTVRTLLYDVGILSRNVPESILIQFQQGFRMLLAGNYGAASSFLEQLSAMLTALGKSAEAGVGPNTGNNAKMTNPNKRKKHESAGAQHSRHRRPKSKQEGTEGGAGTSEGWTSSSDEGNGADGNGHGMHELFMDILRLINHVSRWKRIAAVNMSSRAPHVRRETRRWTIGKDPK